MSRPKKMLPVVGQEPPEPETPKPETPHEEVHEEAGACSEACCSEEASSTNTATPKTREANPEVPEVPSGGSDDGDFDRTVVRVEGMDCASCAATVEKRVGQLPGVHRATSTSPRAASTPSTTQV